MKVILSRKGFDSANGMIPSPIFDDGTMLSLPIPSKDKDSYDDLQYNGISYSKILRDLHYKGGFNCHIDPDLDCSRRIEKNPSWQPAFGQINSSASYLIDKDEKIKVKEGDLFLFFGNFHRVIQKDGSFVYNKKSGNFYDDNDIQVIWGYLQVGKVLKDSIEQKELTWHPHANEEMTSNKTNVIFTASEKLSFLPNKSGAGLLTYDIKRVLTKENCSKATWKYNKIYDVNQVLSNRRNRAKDPYQSIYYAGIWQELILKESKECSLWAKSIIE